MDKIKKEHAEFISQMTLKEKAESTVMENGRCFVTERLGNEGFFINDNPRGNDDYMVETPEQRSIGYHPVAFPQAAAQAATFDTTAAEKIGEAMGRECQLHGVNVLLRPGVNIKRSPLCGRNFEYYSEDPVVAGKMGGAFIRGTQSQGTAADLKHFAVNNQEFERMTTNACVDERTLREIYLKAFEIAVREGNPWTVMSSYNRVNGQWVPASRELMDTLRKEFGFDGAVISDAMAVQTEKVDSHRYGLDFEIGQRGPHTQELQEAIERGILSEEVLDTNIDRLLTLQDRTAKRENIQEVAPEIDHRLARTLAADGLVLLKNDGVLPLQKDAKIAVIGALAAEMNYMGCGSGHMNGWRIDSALEELKLEGAQIVSYAAGYEIVDHKRKEKDPQAALIEEAVRAADEADVVVFFTGLPIGYESEGYDRTTLELPHDQTEALKKVLACGKKTVVVNVSGAPVDLRLCADRAAAILHGYLAGEALGGAIADVLTGKAEPGGRLPETFPLRLQDTPAYMSMPHYPNEMLDVNYGEGIFVGYRWYEKRQIEVLFPFGAGLSYTKFAWSGIHADKASYGKDETIQVSVTIKNVGSRTGSEVVQVYVGKKDSRFISPEKELKGFAKVTLSEGEEKTVTIDIPVRDVARWHARRHCWIVEKGSYELYVARSSADVAEVLTIEVDSEDRAHRYTGMDAVEWYMKAPEIEKVVEDMPENVKEQFGEGNRTMADLIGALPIYRMAEGSALGPTSLTAGQVAEIKDRLNRS